MLRHPLQTASLAPSSPFLATQIANSLALAEAQVVVELGVGTGSLTQAILPRLRPDASYIGLDRNADLLAVWRKRFPGHRAILGDAADLTALCAEQGIQLGQVCCIVSGLPWPSFPLPLQQQALGAIAAMLRPGGQVVTFGYHIGLMMPSGQRFHRMLPTHFQRVERLPWEWRNLPPAFVVRCTRG
ncbi:MAG: methyltransferase domain-containing protein [Bryobacterales bacterium]|nr:methyltransferase domain-containing protein [Bryobacterales bacterium]